MIVISSKEKFFEKHKAELFEKYKAEFAKWNENRKPVSLKSLELAFTDLNGVNYYRFPEALQLPLERWSKAKDYMQWMAAGLTSSELKKLIDYMDKALGEFIKTGKEIARIGFALTEMREREMIIIHSELIYNFLAVHWIREDEEPTVIDSVIHQQKVEQFKIEVANKDTYFFFQERELKKIYEPFGLSTSELTAFFLDSIVKQEALKKTLQNYLSAPKSANIMTDSSLN